MKFNYKKFTSKLGNLILHKNYGGFKFYLVDEKGINLFAGDSQNRLNAYLENIEAKEIKTNE